MGIKNILREMMMTSNRFNAKDIRIQEKICKKIQNILSVERLESYGKKDNADQSLEHGNMRKFIFTSSTF